MKLTQDQINILSKCEIKQASIKTKIDDGSICKTCKGKLKTAGGYKWQYFNN